MNFSTAETGMPDVLDVSVSEEALTVELSDGRTLAVPTGWYPRLAYAKEEERSNWTIIDGGQGIHWRELDEDVSLAGLLAGRASSEGQPSLQRWLDRRSEDRETLCDIKPGIWIQLSHPDPMPMGSKPSDLRFPDGRTVRVRHQYELVVELTKWLRQRGCLPDEILPIYRYASPRPHRDLDHLLDNRQPLVVARTSRDSLRDPKPREAGDLWIAGSFAAPFTVENMLTIIECAGRKPSEFAVRLRKVGRSAEKKG